MRRFRGMARYEHRSEPLLARPQFMRRLAGHGLFALTVVAGSLGLGVLGTMSSRVCPGWTRC